MQVITQRSRVDHEGIWRFAHQESPPEGALVEVTEAEALRLKDEGEMVAGFLVAQAGNKKYRRRVDALASEIKKERRGADIPATVFDHIAKQATAETVLLDFRWLTDAAGNALEATEENRLMILKCDPKVERFVLACARDDAEYDRRALEESAGKSPAGSIGTIESTTPD